MWCTSTPYVVGSSCSHRTVIIAVCLSTAAHAPAEQQQQQQQEQRHSSNPRGRSVRASPCLCVGAEGADHSLDHSRISCWPSKRRRRSWASHSTWTTPPPAGRLQHIPAHAVGPAFWGGEGREWCLSKNEQSEGVFLDSWFSSCCCSCFWLSSFVGLKHPHRICTPFPPAHRIPSTAAGLSLSIIVVLLVSLLTLQPSPLAAARPSIARIARIASQRPVHASSQASITTTATTATTAFKHASDSTTVEIHPR